MNLIGITICGLVTSIASVALIVAVLKDPAIEVAPKAGSVLFGVNALVSGLVALGLVAR